MGKYTRQTKLKVIKEYLNGHLGYRRLSAKLGISAYTIRRWVDAYRLHGDKSFERRHIRYPAEFKLSVLQHMWDNGATINQAAAFFNIPHSDSIRTWAKRYNEGGSEALGRVQTAASDMATRLPPHDDKPAHELTREELLKRVEYLQMEVAVLKKLEALTQAKKAAAQKKRK